MPLAKHNDMVKAFPPEASRSAVPQHAHSARVSAAQWPVTNVHSPKPPGENLAIDLVAIADDVAGVPLPPRASVSCRAIHSGIRSGAGRAKESASHKAADERVGTTKRSIEAIPSAWLRRPIGMVAQKSLPSLRWGVSCVVPYIWRGLTNVDAKLEEELATGPGSAPERVGEAHVADNLADFERQYWCKF
jgi:hypothetical protein